MRCVRLLVAFSEGPFLLSQDLLPSGALRPEQQGPGACPEALSEARACRCGLRGWKDPSEAVSFGYILERAVLAQAQSHTGWV